MKYPAGPMDSTKCIYCGQRATTHDHVPPKLLLERPLPSNLLTVPSCVRCNQGASLDEQYFLVLLGQISSSPTITAMASEGGVIDRTLSRSLRLEQRIIESLEVDEQGGRVVIRPEIERVKRVIRKIALGLFALRYGHAPPADVVGPIGAYPYQPDDVRPLPYFLATFTERFRSKKWKSIQRGVFSYLFVKDPTGRGKVWCVMDIHQALWGVVHFPNPKSFKAGSNRQLSLFSEAQIPA